MGFKSNDNSHHLRIVSAGNIMRKSFRYLVIWTTLSILGIGSAEAAFVTETWQSTVTSASNPAFAAGDTFSWTVTYDNASLMMHRYLDGANGIAEFGAGDDVLSATFCAGTEIGAAGCTINVASDTLEADAEFDLSSFYDVMAASGLTGADIALANNSNRYADASGQLVNFVADDFLFLASNNNDLYTGEADTYYTDDLGKVVSTLTTFTSVLKSTAPAVVPLPSSLSLFAMGLVGLGVNCRRKRKN